MHAHNSSSHSGPPVVLVHGNPETAEVWNPLLAQLGRTDVLTLSPPGFGQPAPSGFAATVDGYQQWLIAMLERFREPVDLVGHSLGGMHVAQVAMSRPDLIRSWASAALGLFAPDYQWHDRARTWQQEGAGEESVRQIFGGTLDHRLAVATGIGMTGPTAERVAAGFDDGMGRAVLTLLRSAAQPVMADAGRRLAAARRRPGLALLAMADTGASAGTLDQHRRMAELSGATIAELAGVGHWWPLEDPRPAAAALSAFWDELNGR
ncbi:alpha/beta fold hydrolase [Pseudonocardia sp. ICBG1293]|uniref:alpha/beta fold hydrolase n=1 Tax=Pseudonocardia sp. ICBG1293 TaxID=2844382 RepID=UPI001CCFF30F|nr:alpha/beta hydrolase [Pseudonocardia sp. ICBG1293]